MRMHRRSAHRDAPDASRESGFTLIELIVSASLSLLVLLLVGTLVTGALRGQQRTDAVAAASNQGALVSDSISTAVRSSVGVTSGPLTSRGQILLARVASLSSAAATTPTWRCHAWYYSIADDAVYTTSSASSWGLKATSNPDLSGWNRLADGVTLIEGVTEPFTVQESGVPGVYLDLVVPSEVGRGTRIQKTIKSQTIGATTTGAPTCF